MTGSGIVKDSQEGAAHMANGEPLQTTRSDDVLAGQREFLFPAVRPLYDQPLVLDVGEGVRVRDVDGRLPGHRWRALLRQLLAPDPSPKTRVGI